MANDNNNNNNNNSKDWVAGSGSNSSSSSSRCAACKQLRRRCPSDCIFKPYFPPNDPLRFASVHRIYGTNNVAKMLQEAEEHQRADVAESLYYEAQCRVNDPVYGCVGMIGVLQQEIQRCEWLLAKVEAQIQLLKAQAAAAAAAAPNHPAEAVHVDHPNSH